MRLQLTIAEASAVCGRPWMRVALHDWVQRQGWDGLLGRLRAAHQDEQAGITEASSLAESSC